MHGVALEPQVSVHAQSQSISTLATFDPLEFRCFSEGALLPHYTAIVFLNRIRLISPNRGRLVGERCREGASSG